jgi:copper chaperone CopZ
MNRRTLVLITIVAVWIGAKAYAQQAQHPAVTIQVYVQDMHCQHCAKKIASKLYTLKGVRSVTTNVQSHVALITPATGQQVSAKKIWEALEAIKFTPVKMVTPAGVFAKKPAA